MLLKGNAIIEGTATIETLPISNSSLSAVVQIDGSLYKRELGSISTAAKEAYIPGLSVSFPTIFNLNTEGLDYNNRSLVVSLKNQLQGTAFMAPVTMTGTPAFRRIVKSDLTDASVLFSDDARIANWNTAYGWGDFRDFGLGTTSQSITTNLSSISNTSFSIFGSTSSTIDAPYSHGSVITIGINSSEFTQLLVPTISTNTSSSIMYRGKQSTRVNPWVKVYDELNLTKLSQLTNDLNLDTLFNYAPKTTASYVSTSIYFGRSLLGLDNSSSSEVGEVSLWQSLLSNGVLLFKDVTFKEGLNGVVKYSNITGTLTRIVDNQNSGNKSGYILRVVNTSGGSQGIVQNTSSKINSQYVQIIRAKIPIGYRLNHYNNLVGNGATFKWLTSTWGTGKWEWYILSINTGNSGTFSTFGYIGLTGGGISEANPITWYISHMTMSDLTDYKSISKLSDLENDINFDSSYVKKSGDTMTGTINTSINNIISFNGSNRLHVDASNIVLGGNTTDSGGIYFRPQGTTITTNEVNINGTGAIYTSNGNGNSSQWKQAFDWGNHATQGYLKSIDLQNYYTKTESINQFVGVGNVQNIGGTKTFTVSPIVPTATLSSHVINKGQVESWVNAQGFVTTDTTYNVFTRTVDGLVPAPTGSTSTRYLREDGTWVVPTNTTYSAGTLAQLNAGTVTTNYLWSPKNLSDYVTALIPSTIWTYLGTNLSTSALGTSVFGTNNQASGISTYVKGNNNIGQGYNITTIGSFITHIGNNGYSYGSNLLALGNYNNIDGSNITALGYGLEGNEEGVTIVGKYNKPSDNPIYSGTEDSNLFVIGGGKSAFDRANAYEMKNDFRGIFFGKQKYNTDYSDFSGNEMPSAEWVLSKVSQGGGGGSLFRLRSSNENYLTGDVTLIGGTNISLTQVGNNITIHSIGSGSGGGSDNMLDTATSNLNTGNFNGVYDSDSNSVGGVIIEGSIGLAITVMQHDGSWNQGWDHKEFYGEWAVLSENGTAVTQGTILIKNTMAETIISNQQYYLIATQNVGQNGTVQCMFVNYNALRNYKEQAQLERSRDVVLLGKITRYQEYEETYVLKVHQTFF